MSFRWIKPLLLLGVGLCGTSIAQTSNQIVKWSASPSESIAKNGSRISVALSAEIQEGWHVYGLSQLPGGPTPLRVSIDENEIVQATGNVTGSAPQKKHDPSFDLETQIYTHSFALQVPAEVKSHTANGKQLIPVNVRFQACSERTCLPPRTAHLSVPIEISGGK